MYNSKLPNESELPSSRQLLISTVGAAAVASVLLVTTVLPAEYGIDPTGLGKVLGLTQMGEIKTTLAAEAEGDAANAQAAKQEAAPSRPAVAVVTPAQAASVTEANTVQQAEPAQVVAAENTAEDQVTTTPNTVVAEPTEPELPSDTQQFTLAPGAAAEIKLGMREGASVSYEWLVEGGAVNFDTHGDNATTSYFAYGKGRNSEGEQGELVAAFDGSHGWFWRNRSPGTVTVTLKVQGDYQGIKRVL